ncbi:ATP-dependent helicase HepA [Lachnospiraceae bacterium XBB2008]|nr:ATP-dependent helicase HepA [Lachnospiraceae bacterium XBB2008]
MLGEKMYVRCPADNENMAEPRVFVCGQIVSVDEFKKTVEVKINDPFKNLVFFEDLPRGTVEYPTSVVDRCSLFIGSLVVYKSQVHKILSCQKQRDEYYYYYLQNQGDRSVNKVCEKNIIASFNNGQIDSSIQLKRYEFQNPCWFLGRAVVSKSMNVLDNSIYGFKELAGSKIYLMPHQVNSIMRCLQENPCRYMLADEVGMGKTVEAISVYKIFTLNESNTKSLIIVPEALKAQWTSELLLKFNIPIGISANNNSLIVKTIEELEQEELTQKWDFLIIDEVHRYIFNPNDYQIVHKLSQKARNVLILSATPVQQKKEEYLNLLRLLMPQKYDQFSSDRFEDLINKQGKIIQKTALILDDLGDFEDEIESALENMDSHESEECQELYEEIHDDLEEICEELDDKKLKELLDKISIDSSDLGVYDIKVIISYICGNYQIESNIIRNRRKILESDDEEEKLVASRDLLELTYNPDNDRNVYEYLSYEELSNWAIHGIEAGSLEIEKDIKPLLSSFFSSPWAFGKELDKYDLDEVKENVERWAENEQYNIDHIEDILNDPDSYSESFASRLVVVINALFDEFYDKKVVLFTNYIATFEAYKKALINSFPEEEISFFGANMPTDEIELNAYRFQNQKDCRIILCDYTGGEGRNFQCADYVLHIDLPWDASAIEQRIGRLDRLERDMSRPVVYSVVVHTEKTFEDALFNFFKEGLHIFNQSLSGMEIIMKDINDEIISAIKDDFKYGLFEKIPAIVELANKMRDEIRKEQNFDAAGFIYRPMYSELRRLIDYYTRNENELFSVTMSNWASLAGFRGSMKKTGEITYSASSFSPRSAINSQLIPPRWNDYLSTEQNRFLVSVQEAYDKKMARKTQDRSIRGTFSRKLAIENDYLHFFAPGDEVFDCIVDNAINSCKGCSSAFAVKCGRTWTGLIYTWSIEPNTVYLLDNGVSMYSMSPYRNYLLSDQVISPISIMNDDGLSDEEIIREYSAIINRGFVQSKTVHLGKRSREAGFLKDVFEGRNIDWFRNQFGGEKWRELISTSRKDSHDRALEIFKRKSNIKGAREEMERLLSARVANNDYYDLDDAGIEELKRTQEIIMEAIRHPKIRLESAAFIMMIGDKNE